MMSFCDEQHHITLSTNHRLINQLVNAAMIHKRVLTWYLIQDHHFLDAFVVLLASAITNMDCLAGRSCCSQYSVIMFLGDQDHITTRTYSSISCTIV